MAMLVQHLKQKIKMVLLLSNMYELKIASGKLLYNTGSLAWCSVMTRRWKSLSRFFATPWTIQPMEFARPEY